MEWIDIKSGELPEKKDWDKELLIWKDDGLELPVVGYYNKKQGFYQFNDDDYSLNTDEFIYLDASHWFRIKKPVINREKECKTKK